MSALATAALLAAETGQPQTIVDMMQYGAAMSAFEYYAGAADKFHWKEIRDGVYGQTLVVREPIGVVGAVTAWNVPFFLAANKLGPALVAGCTIVVKPAAETPLSLFAMAASRHGAAFAWLAARILLRQYQKEPDKGDELFGFARVL